MLLCSVEGSLCMLQHAMDVLFLCGLPRPADTPPAVPHVHHCHPGNIDNSDSHMLR